MPTITKNMNSIPPEIDALITDRSQNDVNELTEKGVYRAEDCNRVETAVKFLANSLVELPNELKEYAASKNVAWSTLFDVPYNPEDYKTIITKTDWGMDGQLFGSEIAPTIEETSERYLGNVVKLRNALDFQAVDLPKTINRLTYYNANAIEIVLKKLYNAIEVERENIMFMIDSVTIGAFSGEYYSDEAPWVN